MPGASISNTVGTFPEPEPTAGPGAAISRAASLEVVRRGSPEVIQDVIAIAEAEGDLEPDTHYEPEADDELEGSDEEKLDVDNGDEDDFFLDGWDEVPRGKPDAGQAVAGGGLSDDSFDQSAGWRLLVDGGTCRLDRPSWIRHRGTNAQWIDWMNQLQRRAAFLEEIARWLSEYRQKFLEDPQPWNLGLHAFEELKGGWALVAHTQFLEGTGLISLGEKSVLTSFMGQSRLVWPDGCTLPLNFIFGRAARMAWVANAVKSMAESVERSMEDVLTKFAKTAIPQGGQIDWAEKPFEPRDMEGSIIKANAMADTKWTDVVEAFREKMLT